MSATGRDKTTASQVSKQVHKEQAPGSRLTLYLTYGSAVSILFSISISQILLALALAALLLSGERLRFPPIKIPLALFFLDTIVAVLLSGHAQAGTPQIRKFFVFAMLLVVSSAFQSVKHVRLLVLLWSAAVILSAVSGFAQLLHRRAEAYAQHANNYGFYLDDRMTGFASHWMTFGGEEMVVALMLASFLLFTRAAKWKAFGWAGLLVLLASLVLGLTRSIFLLGLPLGGLYLLWSRNRWLCAAVPVIALIAAIAAPVQVRERVMSVVRPHGEVDSNAHRYVTRRTGWEMVKAHPWFGIGPEQVLPQFEKYVPADIPRPLPRGWYGHLHNIYLEFAAERGIPGMLCMMWVIGKLLIDFLRALRHPSLPPESRFVLHGAVSVILAILAEGFFEYNLGDSEVLTLFLTVMACGYVVSLPSRAGGGGSFPAIAGWRAE